MTTEYVGGKGPVESEDVTYKRRQRKYLFRATVAGIILAVCGLGVYAGVSSGAIKTPRTLSLFLDANILHRDAADRFLTAVENNDEALFNTTFSHTCGPQGNSPCLHWIHLSGVTLGHHGHKVWFDGKYVHSFWVEDSVSVLTGGTETALDFIYDANGLIINLQ